MPHHRPPTPRAARGVVTTTAALALLSPLLVAQAPSAQAVDTTSPVVVSEVYGGGGNTGAPYKNDFVELYNTGTTAVDLSTWSVQYGSATGSSYALTRLTGTIAPGAYYLVAEAAGTGTAPALPTPDATGTLAMSGTAGKIALVSNQTVLACGADCDGAAGVVDFVGYGGANDYAGTGPTGVLSNTTSAQRTITPFANTGDNSKDFTVAAPTPKAAPGSTGGGGGGTDCGVTPLPTECTPGPATIQDVQGDGFVSPLKGQTVTRVPGVVTAVSTGSPKGFWVQDPTPDTARTTASSGVFVFTSAAAPAVGSAVVVSGTVSDYYPLSSGETLATTASLSTTEIINPTVTTVSTGNAVPVALALTPDTVPALYAPAPADGNVESISPVDPTHSALEFWEAHEGMLVSVDDAPVVGPGKPQYGEIYVTTKPEDKRTPRGGTYLPSYVGTPSGRLLVAPLAGVSTPPANVGDVLTGTTSGPVDWSSYGGYSLRATRIGTWQDNHLAPGVARASASDQLSVATYNVENLAPSDPQAKFDRLAAGVVTNLRSPDVITVEEVQDNTGATDDGTTASDVTVAKLTAAITAAGGPSYSSTSIDPVNDQDGGQPGGNIRIVFLYNAARVGFTPKGTPSATTAVTVTKDVDGTPTLSTNPGRIDPTNPAFDSSRKPLAAEFTFQGKKLIVVGNHWNSKGGDQSADGRFQPPTRSSEVQRVAQATAVHGFVQDVLGVDAGANLVLAGDFNDYQFSTAVTTLTDDGATLTDLITTLPEDERYTYVFNGISQVLDHIVVSKAITDVEYDVVHVNAEFSDQASDHDPQVARIRPAAHVAPVGTLTVSPKRQSPGQYVQVRLNGSVPQVAVAVQLDGTGPKASLRTNKNGAGTTSFFLPVSTSRGIHQIVATLPDGRTVSTPVRVVAP
ncbi:lamin tail domain-containing protein [Lapillicoccus jejuensis]|uniref:LTD domain-containing protein n=1 Tax=Lapillicoccus jejuensis TaxID=402171 RepID=A0A542E5D6_9MICO|nr:lamin tail domain-containing protein [Lapillicoccus jejuensis]TQJ10551.1 hypothetical protein FB458_3680 [Lapillicoccus jejuensis]